ncbi:MAG: Alcohol dehydrogenase zinc-binding domain protein [Fluviicola sp.]|jgi:NADPH:quinone reductase-like Zn-dependent oxidoreductase|uniref:NAD(P)-dependent alcohol dehydrogenase n=1 Tax=Fluviicola sp. TaxID=1917219 RepID=UPI002609F566|nr:NAD(P)-dependent alcohol dehydrogenase [Fluviicola sp.]MDF3026228.1 Alcohol dehydrogenase zinc-binding domain protein [Fluviicola sp.]
MKAAIRRSYGSPQNIQIEEIERPVPNDNEVLIKVMATTVNRTDCANLTAKPFIMRLVLGLFNPRKITLGTDFAGIVVETGKNIQDFNLNDRVFGFTDLGLESQAEYVKIVPKGNLLIMPEKSDFKQAAASLEGAHYAYSFIQRAKIKPGQSILIHGATGAIGSASLQFAKQFDVRITATCNTKNIPLIQSLGADKVIDFTKDDFTKDTEKYDLIFDAVGKSTFGKCKSLLKNGGIYISSELGPYAQNPFLALFPSLGDKKKVIFPIPFSVQKTLPYIKNLLEKEQFKPVIDREYSLDEISKAYEYVMTGEKTGNVIISLENTED